MTDIDQHPRKPRLVPSRSASATRVWVVRWRTDKGRPWEYTALEVRHEMEARFVVKEAAASIYVEDRDSLYLEVREAFVEDKPWQLFTWQARVMVQGVRKSAR